MNEHERQQDAEAQQQDQAQRAGHGNEDLQKLMMAGLGAVAHLKEKSAKWFDEMAAKGKDAAQDMQPTLDEWAKKGKETLDQGKAFGADAMGKLQRTIDGMRDEAGKGLGPDEIAEGLKGLTEDALRALRAKIDELLPPDDPQP